MKIFISGRITGDPYYKTKFNQAASFLEARGYIVLNPATLPQGMIKDEYMQIGLTMLECADSIYMLNDWQTSQGAKVEYEYAKYLGKAIFFQDNP